MRYCRDCNYKDLSSGSGWQLWGCRSPGNFTDVVNIVTGEYHRKAQTCVDCRLDEKLCGFEGNWFLSYREALKRNVKGVASLPDLSAEEDDWLASEVRKNSRNEDGSLRTATPSIRGSGKLKRGKNYEIGEDL